MRVREKKDSNFKKLLFNEFEKLDACERDFSHSTMEEKVSSTCYCQPWTQSVPSYLIDSLYDYHLLRWTQYFPLKNFLFISSLQLSSQTDKVLKRIESFLGISHHNFGPLLNERFNVRGTNQTDEFLDLETKKRLEILFENTYHRVKLLTGIDLRETEIPESN